MYDVRFTMCVAARFARLVVKVAQLVYERSELLRTNRTS